MLHFIQKSAKPVSTDGAQQALSPSSFESLRMKVGVSRKMKAWREPQDEGFARDSG